MVKLQLGRQCSRQQIEQCARAGKLPDSTLKTSPVRMDPKLVVAEYQAKIALKHGTAPTVPYAAVPQAADTARPMGVPPPHAAAPAMRDGEPGDDWSLAEATRLDKLETARLRRIKRLREEEAVIDRALARRTWGAALGMFQSQLKKVGANLKRQRPHLGVEDILAVEDLIADALEELASVDV